MLASWAALCGAQLLLMPHKALELNTVAVCSNEALSQGQREQAMSLCGRQRLSPHIERRAISHLWMRLLECCKGASAEAQEAQTGPAGAAGPLYLGCAVLSRTICFLDAALPCVLGFVEGSQVSALRLFQARLRRCLPCKQTRTLLHSLGHFDACSPASRLVNLAEEGGLRELQRSTRVQPPGRRHGEPTL